MMAALYPTKKALRETPTPTPTPSRYRDPWYYQHLPRSTRKGKTREEIHNLREAAYYLLHPKETT